VKIAVISPDDLSTIIFAKTLTRMLHVAGGFEVFTVSAVDRYAKEISELHSTHIDVPMTRFIHPLKDVGYFFRLYRVLRLGKFDAVLTFATKPNIYGILAARLAGVGQIIMAVRGLGRAFNPPESLAQPALKVFVLVLYRSTCRLASRVWFTNPHDREYFVSRGIVPDRKTLVTKNAVNLSDYSVHVVSQERLGQLRVQFGLGVEDKVVIMVARLIWAKGIQEFADAAVLLKQSLPQTVFILVGPPEGTSPGAVPESYIRRMENRARLHWLGFRKDVREFYALADLAVLPSFYKEGGYPRALLEPMAMGKPVIAADTRDCRGPVDHGRNGFLVPPRDAHALARAIERILENDQLRTAFGAHSVKKVREDFDDRKVISQLIRELGWQLGPKSQAAGSL